jgi:hypothetical protein
VATEITGDELNPLAGATPAAMGSPDYWAIRYPVTAERIELGARVMFWVSAENRLRGRGAAVEARAPQLQAEAS